MQEEIYEVIAFVGCGHILAAGTNPEKPRGQDVDGALAALTLILEHLAEMAADGGIA